MRDAKTQNAKTSLRQTVLTRRAAMAAREREAASSAIAEGVIAALEQLAPATVALYVALEGECDVQAVMAWAFDKGVKVVLPATVGREQMVFRSHRRGAPLVDGGFGTSTPPASAEKRTPDVIVVPLVAFDRTGGRLGWGRGYYDRALRAMAASGSQYRLLGAAFSLQEAPEVPMEDHDVRLDAVITELETIHC